MGEAPQFVISTSFPERRRSLAREAHRVDWRQIVRKALPAVAAVFAHVEVARGATERQRVAVVVERVAIDIVERILLREPLAKLLPALAAIGRARDEEPAVDGHALVV